jgi:hypothetical protein
MNPNDLFKGPSLNRYLLAALAICGPTLTAMAATGPIISITPGLVSTYAGSLSDGGATGNGGPATSANLYFPSVSRFDSAGNLYILDAGDNVIRKVSASGTISAFAFTGAPGNTGDGGPATAATLGANAAGLFVTSAGVVYVSDTANNAIRMINASGQISTVVGTSGAAGGYTGDGGAPTSATLNSPEGLYVDGAGDIFFADTANNAVREVTGGVIKTIAGGNTTVCAGHLDTAGDGCQATNATLISPTDVWLDASGNIYILDAGNYRVRKITVSTGIITSIMGGGTKGTSATTTGAINTYATFLSGAVVPSGGLYVDTEGDVFLADTGLDRVLMLNAKGVVSIVAGNGILSTATALSAGLGDGLGALSAQLYFPQGVTGDANNNLYITDTQNSRIREVNVAAGYLVTYSGVVASTTIAAQTITIYNPGTTTLTLTGFTITAPYVEKSAGATECTQTTSLTPGSSCVITVQFIPTVAGETTGSVTIQSNATNAPSGASVVQLAGLATVVTTATLSSTTTMTSTLPAPPVVFTGTSFTLTATVTPPTGNTMIPTGQVQFVYGSTSLGLVTLNASGVATLTVSSLPPGEQNLIAYYLGDANFKASTGAALVVESYPATGNPGFGFTSSASAVTLTGQTGTATVNLSAYSINGYANIVSFSCVLPAPLSCSFLPYVSYIAPGKQSTPVVVMTVTAPAPLSQMRWPNSWRGTQGVFAAFALLGCSSSAVSS